MVVLEIVDSVNKLCRSVEAIKSEIGGEGRDDLGNESVQVGVGGSLDIKVSFADIVESESKL